jgi:D-sedoheptulose 7-phosphate isomerase
MAASLRYGGRPSVRAWSDMSLLTEPLQFLRADLAAERALACCEQAWQAHCDLFARLPACFPAVASAGERMAACLAAGGKLLLCGNGGSAATAHHLAAQLMARPARQGHPLAGVALSDHAPTVTGLGERFGFDHIFARQVQALGRPGDALLVISAGEPARNLLHAVRSARDGGLLTIGLLSDATQGGLARACHLSIELPTASMDLLDEAQLFIGHQLCAVIEAAQTNL